MVRSLTFSLFLDMNAIQTHITHPVPRPRQLAAQARLEDLMAAALPLLAVSVCPRQNAEISDGRAGRIG